MDEIFEIHPIANKKGGAAAPPKSLGGREFILAAFLSSPHIMQEGLHDLL